VSEPKQPPGNLLKAEGDAKLNQPTAALPQKLSYQVLGVPIAAVQIPDVVAQMEEWIAGRERSHYICVANVHVIMEGRHDSSFGEVLRSADLCVPDGMPLVWLGRHRGHALHKRVYGPDLLIEFCRMTKDARYAHFFLGGKPGVAEKLSNELQGRFPGFQVAGIYSPPFRQLTQEEDEALIERINRAAPDVLWIGLGCPKQERWMREHRDKLHVPAVVGVGQAFDIHSGDAPQAPGWMRENGLEWVYRLYREPRRLWRRYLIYNTKFIFTLLFESLHSKSPN
jgi:N-acetylglucosaminyldiphosphoundecaprenol N-acetyl-beta-D-mannosaminyltransferase